MSRKPYLSLLVCFLTVLGLLPAFQQSAASQGSDLSLTATRGIVGSSVRVILLRFPQANLIDISWDGRRIATIEPDQSTGFGTGSFKVPAATKGFHTVSALLGGKTMAATQFEVIPRIKVIPGVAGWGEQVNVSLRGYAPWTTVRIRWLRGSTWIEVARVSSSRTGSANAYVTVPSWAPAGPNSVRGDAVTVDGGRAQTNAFKADRLIYKADQIESMDRQSAPTATPSPTLTPSPTPTVRIEPTAESTFVPTNTPTAMPTPTGTPMALGSG